MQITFVKNGKRIKHDNAQWEMMAANLTCADVTPYTERKSTQRILLHEASERQAKHPDIAKVEKAVKYFKEKRDKWRLDTTCFSSMGLLYQYNCLLNGSLGTGNKEVMTNHPKIANCDY